MLEAAPSSKEEIPQTVPILGEKLVHFPINNSHKNQHLQKLHVFSVSKYMIGNLKLICNVNLSDELSASKQPDTYERASQ